MHSDKWNFTVINLVINHLYLVENTLLVYTKKDNFTHFT